MTGPAPLRNCGHPDRLDSERFALLREFDEVRRRAHDRVEPIELAESLGAEDEANIVPVAFDLAAHLAYFVLRQPKSVRSYGNFRKVRHSHDRSPRLLAQIARGMNLQCALVNTQVKSSSTRKPTGFRASVERNSTQLVAVPCVGTECSTLHGLAPCISGVSLQFGVLA